MTRAIEEDDDQYLQRILAEERQRQAETLSRAKAEALTSGREPFDLAELEMLCDASRDGVMDAVEERTARFEYLYYVVHPELTTMKELARYIEQTSRW